MDVKSVIKAARLRTLPLSISGIIVGSFLGNHFVNSQVDVVSQSVFASPIFWLAIITTIGFQVLSNFANDYGDGIKGSDKNRIGEARMVSSGKITPKQMKNAMIFTAIFTLIVALFLIYTSFEKENFGYSMLFFFLGIASIAAAIKYTVGKSAYGYSGFGDVFVFLFFGLLSVLGSYFLFTKQFDFQLFLPAIAIGFLSTAVLNLNNLRDEEQDKINNKNTLVVKLGTKKAKNYHFFLIFGALFVSNIFVIMNYQSAIQFLYLIAFIPLIKNVITVAKNNNPSTLDGELKKVALSTFLFAIIFGIVNTL
jgi:1,4-dihydroxy-2-naphthoate octaprenyltransferase